MKKFCVILFFALFSAIWLSSAGGAEKAAPHVDLDLTQFNGMVAYTGLFNIFTDPAPYVGKVIKLKGQFDCADDPETGRRYFGVSLVDASACCAVGLDFVLKDNYKYPEDYPKIGENVTVAGRFELYREGEDVFARLVEADIM